jgi:hypothetical protein
MTSPGNSLFVQETSFIISVDSGVNSVYMDPDNQNDAAPQYVQIWNFDPVMNPNKQIAETMQWYINYNENDDDYNILLGPSKQNALAYKNYNGNYDQHLWILKYNPDDRTQRWHFTHININSATDNTYVISSAENSNYGLIRQVDVATDTYVMVQRMWGGPTPIFAWYITPTPSDLASM